MATAVVQKRKTELEIAKWLCRTIAIGCAAGLAGDSGDATAHSLRKRVHEQAETIIMYSRAAEALPTSD